MGVHLLICIWIMLTHQYKSILCQQRYSSNGQGLTAIPSDIPTSTTEVWLQYNRITTIEANAFSHLSQLTKLYLGFNEISEVKLGAFNGLTALIWLKLDSNRLERLYANMFYHLTSCTQLYLPNNRISEVEPGSFNQLGNLQYLWIDGNRLTSLMSDTFQGLMVVNYLDLKNNSIHSIHDNVFNHLKELRTLKLDRNDLEVLYQGTFSGLDSVKILHLEGNRLKTLPEGVFNHLPRPLQLELHYSQHTGGQDNVLHCDDELCWLKQEEIQGTITLVNKPRCSSGRGWDNWSCKDIGSMSSSIDYTTTGMSERANGMSDNLNLILISVGIAVGIAVAVTVVFFICRKRRDFKLCQRNTISQIEDKNTEAKSGDQILNSNVKEQHDYTTLRGDREDYEEIADSVVEKQNKNETQNREYQNVRDPELKNYINQAISMTTKAESGSSFLQSRSRAYENVPDTTSGERKFKEKSIELEVLN